MEIRFNFRFLLTGLYITCVTSSSPHADATHAFVFSRDYKQESVEHYITDGNVREDFLSKACKVGDFLVLIDWSSFVFIKEDFGFVERGVTGLKENEWLQIEEILKIKDAKSKALEEDWLILEAIATKV